MTNQQPTILLNDQEIGTSTENTTNNHQTSSTSNTDIITTEAQDDFPIDDPKFQRQFSAGSDKNNLTRPSIVSFATQESSNLPPASLNNLLSTQNSHNSNCHNAPGLTESSYIHPSKLHGSSIIVNDTTYQNSPDGGWGWVIVAAVWIDNMCVLGMLKSFPVLYSEFKSHEWSDGTENLNFRVSLISSIALSMRASCAPLAAALTNRYNERTVVLSGALMVVIGLILSSQATAIWHLYVTMGMISGCGFALASMPALALIGRYFNKKRSLANGISRSGGGAFFFLSPLLAYISEQRSWTIFDLNGWKLTLLICAFIELLLCAAAFVFKPIYLKSELEFDRKATIQKFAQDKEEKNKDYKKITDISGYQKMSQNQLAETKKMLDIETQEKGITESMIVNKFPQIQPQYQPKVKMLDFRLMKDPLWIMCTLNLVLTQFAYSGCLIHMTARTNAVLQEVSKFNAENQSDETQQSIPKSTIMSIVGLCEIISQLSAASIGDRGWTSRLRLHQIYISIIVFGVVLSVILPQTPNMLMACAAILGLGAGAWQANILTVTADTLGVVKLRSAYGLCLFFSGVCGQLLGAPFIGFILDQYQGQETAGYQTAFSLMAVILILAILVLQLDPWAKKKVLQKEMADKVQFEVTQSIAVDIKTLLDEFANVRYRNSILPPVNENTSTSNNETQNNLLNSMFSNNMEDSGHEKNLKYVSRRPTIRIDGSNQALSQIQLNKDGNIGNLLVSNASLLNPESVLDVQGSKNLANSTGSHLEVNNSSLRVRRRSSIYNFTVG